MQPLIFREILSVTMILFAIIDILGAIPVIIQVRQRVGHIESEKASIAVLVLMVVFLFVGDELLAIIGLDISSFAIAGSLNWIGHWYQRDGAWSAEAVASRFAAQLTEGLAKDQPGKRGPATAKKGRPAKGGRK